MTLEEENKALRSALNYANNAIFLITTTWVHENHMSQVAQVLEKIQQLTPPERL